MVVRDLIPMTVDKLRGRSDLSGYTGTPGSDIPSWIYQSILDLTPSYPFEELVVKGPFVNFQIGISEYPITFFLPKPDTLYTQIRSFFRYFQTANPPPTGSPNIVGNQLKARNTMTVEPMSVIPGLPIYWCQNSNLILVGFQPDQPYTVFMRYQKPHPFNLQNLLNNTIFMPEDWKEIITFSAALRGCLYLGMKDIATTYYNLLHGDPREPGKVGLIQARIGQRARTLSNNERQMQPIVRRFT